MNSVDWDREVNVKFTYAEIFVLSHLLFRLENDDFEFPIVDQAEERAIWDLTATLEKLPNEVFNKNYDKYLKAARDHLRDDFGDDPVVFSSSLSEKEIKKILAQESPSRGLFRRKNKEQ